MSQRYEGVCLITANANVYHRIGRFDNDFREWTACGVQLDPFWGVGSMDRKRVELFARPCGNCYRKEADRG